jgi:hypothetical protein
VSLSHLAGLERILGRNFIRDSRENITRCAPRQFHAGPHPVCRRRGQRRGGMNSLQLSRGFRVY